jgi:hypothetical protein
MRRHRGGIAALVCLLSACSAGAATVEVPFLRVLDVEGRVEFLDAERFDSGTRRELPQGRIRTHLTADPSSRYRLVLDLTGTAGGTPRDPDGAGVFDFHRVRQDISPSLEVGEAYGELHTEWLDVRAGIQKFAWGKLDSFQPNDLLSPQKYFDPFLEEEIDRKIGVPAISPTLFLPKLDGLPLEEMRVTFAWVPIHVPYYFPDQDERWYPPLARAPAVSEVQGVRVVNRSRFTNGDLPSRTLDNGAYGVRFSGLAAGADFALYYFEGFDPSPALDASAEGSVRLDPAAPGGVDVRSEVTVFPELDRIRSVGGDLAYPLLGATLRAEAAYVMDRPYPRSLRDVVASERVGAVDPAALRGAAEVAVPVTLDPVNVRRDGVEWGIGADRFVGETFVLFQMNQTSLLGNDTNLLTSDFQTRFSLTVRQGFLDDRLQAELRGTYAMQDVAGVAHPRVTYALSDHVDVRVGLLLIAGHERSLLGQYARNDEGYVRLRFSF